MSDLGLQIDGQKVKLNNSLLTIAFSAEGKATSLIYKGQELLNNLDGEPHDPDRYNSFYCDYHVQGGTKNIQPNKLEVIENSAQRIHVAYIDDQHPLGVAYHLLLESNQSLIHSYVKAWNNSDEEYEINEFRTVYRLDPHLFNIGFNAERIGHQPTSEHMLKGKKLQDETYDLLDGSFYSNSHIYSKYDYAGYFKDNPFWGQFGTKYGFWFIPVNTAYYGSGPLNQDLLLHYDGLILNYMCSEHFGKGLFKIPVGWSKVYGPWCIYINDATDLLQDAQECALHEQEQWPYQWMNEAGYSKNVVDVYGQLQVNNKQPDQQFTVVLAKPQATDGYYLQQKAGFTFYSQTDEQGNFVIKNVIPDEYTLYAYSNGGSYIGDYHWDGLQINQDRNLGNFNIQNRNSKIIWQIGTASHTSKGFKFSDQLRNYIWKDAVPNNLTYTIDDSTSEWYYLQNNTGTWQIEFSGDKLEPNKSVELAIAFAGVTQKDMTDHTGPSVQLFLNNKLLKKCTFINDRAAYRSALLSGLYQYVIVKIPRAEIMAGINKLAIKTNGYLIYDSIVMRQ